MSSISRSEFVETIVCPRCESDLPSGQDQCGYCGAPTTAPQGFSQTDGAANGGMVGRGGSDASARRGSKAPTSSLLDSRGFLLAFLFGAAMILGVPLLWRSKAYGTRGKLVLTALVTLYTIAIFWGFALTMAWCYRMITHGGE